MSHPANEVNVVIVGAGPVGLLNAVGLLDKNPQLKIVLLEKDSEYTRHHVVQMDYRQLDKYLDAIDPLECADPVLKQLRDQVKKNKFIRTSEIEEKLKQRALALGATIINKSPVTSVQHDVFDKYPQAKLIIGADGAHSVVSAQVFGPDNIQKYPFDFVMQFRYEVLGDVDPIKLPTLVKFMQSYGTTCDEYVGKKDSKGKTPITFQLMITKEQFDKLAAHAKSKNPIMPFSDAASDPASEQFEKLSHVWPIYIEQIKGYLGLRLREYTPDGQIVDLHSAKISVNEAPATKAKEIYKEVDGRQVILSGDAKLGLSYFKGLNAGIETAAKLLPILASDYEARRQQFIDYARWFDQDYGPAKVKEVEHYSVFIINLVVKVFRFLQLVLGSGFFVNQDEAERSVDLYLGHLNTLDLPHDDKGAIKTPIDPEAVHAWKIYPHRQHLPGHVLSFQHSEIAKYYRQIGKNFTETLTPYKSVYYILRDMFISLRAMLYISKGLLELAMVMPLFIISSAIALYSPGEGVTRLERINHTIYNALLNFQEGTAQLLLGLSLAVSSIFMPVKLIIRFVATHLENEKHGGVFIENNLSMSRLIGNQPTTEASVEQINAQCIDIHRKFKKSVARFQETEVDTQLEALTFKRCHPANPESYEEYLRLFKKAKTEAPNPKASEAIETPNP